MAIGHGPGSPGPFKLAFMINMLAKVGFMRFSSALLGAGPYVAFSAKLGAIRHQANKTQRNDYKLSYSGRAAKVMYWFKDLRAKATELAGRVSQADIPTLVF